MLCEVARQTLQGQQTVPSNAPSDDSKHHAATVKRCLHILGEFCLRVQQRIFHKRSSQRSESKSELLYHKLRARQFAVVVMPDKRTSECFSCFHSIACAIAVEIRLSDCFHVEVINYDFRRRQSPPLLVRAIEQ